MRLFSDSTLSIDDPYLARAYSLALQGRGRTSPNPIVGCVIAAGGRIVGEGYHPAAGMPHAEVYAITDAGDAAKGATAYVTLEPCSHHGRTPPCAEALVEAGVSEVVIGMRDPSEEASGGAAKLRSAGVKVRFADDPTPFAELNAGWLKRLVTGVPYVTAKVGLSLDGRIALGAGQRSDMTGAAGGAVTATLRAQSDAVMVGSATVDVDDPALTVRDHTGAQLEHQPLRVVVAGTKMPSEKSRILSDGASDTLVIAPYSLDSAAPAGVELARYDDVEGLGGALRILGERGVNELLVEPGHRLMTSLWSEGLIDRLVCVTAGGMAGSMGVTSFDGCADSEGSRLIHRAEPEEARIFGDVSVVSWRLTSRPNMT